mmetsp:Transcript_112138/g.281022  ORF Transcript_112138/g.281022 Transcript_112138/m.281022 type:complete len:205 (-) Transcript_112138:262-876(-)
MCCLRRSGTITASASALTVQSYFKYSAFFATCDQTLMKTSVFVSVASPVSQAPFVDCQEWKMSLPSQAKTCALLFLANFIKVTSLELGRIAMKQYNRLPATGWPCGAEGTWYSVLPPAMNVPSQSAGTGMFVLIQVVFLTVCVQPMKFSSLTMQEKPMLQQSLSFAHEDPAQAQPVGMRLRLPKALQLQSLWSPELSQEFMQVA